MTLHMDCLNFVLFFSGSGQLVVATPTDSFNSDFGLVRSEVPFNGRVDVRTKGNDNRVFNCECLLPPPCNQNTDWSQGCPD